MAVSITSEEGDGAANLDASARTARGMVTSAGFAWSVDRLDPLVGRLGGGLRCRDYRRGEARRDTGRGPTPTTAELRSREGCGSPARPPCSRLAARRGVTVTAPPRAASGAA